MPYKSAAAAFLLLSLLSGCSSLPTSTTPVISEVRIQRDQVAQSINSGETALRSRNWVLAEAQFQSALHAAEAVDFLPGQYGALDLLGYLFYVTGKFDQSEAMWLKAQDVARSSNDPKLMARGTANQGRLAVAKGDVKNGLALIDEALSARAQLDPAVVAVFLHSRALALRALERGDEALAALEEAAKLNAGVNAFQEQASNLYLAASIQSKAGKVPEALTNLKAALELDKRAENTDGIAGDLLALATVTGRLEGEANRVLALDYATRAWKASTANQDASGAARALKLADELRSKK